MREQLKQYVELLFAGTTNCEDIKQEILQNTLDRFDDLVAQGKSPEAAYRLAISGIGDLGEILGTIPQQTAPAHVTANNPIVEETEQDEKRKKLRALAIVMYILCLIPLIILDEFGLDIIGLCLTVVIAAVATYIMIVTSKKDNNEDEEDSSPATPQNELKKSIDNLIWSIGLVVYFIMSFATGAWYITWILFPIIGCVQGLINAIIDLKEATKHEN